MKKIFLGLIGAVGVVLVVVALRSNNVGTAKAATATLSTDVQEYLSFSLTAGDTVSFGNLTPGTPIAGPEDGTVASTTTNAANGYTIGLSDGSDTDSSMEHTDTTTYIPDITSGTIGTPAAWGANKGVGVTLFDADTSYESKWCATTCTAYNDSDNLYAKVPAAATTAHTVTGYHGSADTSSWAFKIDVANTQKTGSYSGDVTFTATAVLS